MSWAVRAHSVATELRLALGEIAAEHRPEIIRAACAVHEVVGARAIQAAPASRRAGGEPGVPGGEGREACRANIAAG
jgi:hypothetical protein